MSMWSANTVKSPASAGADVISSSVCWLRNTPCAHGGEHPLLPLLFLFQAEDGIRDHCVTGVQTCAFLFSSRRRHTRSLCDWSSDVCSSDLEPHPVDQWS